MNRLPKFSLIVKTTMHEYPELLLCSFCLVAGGSILLYNTVKTIKENRFVARYKQTYTVMRVDDERLKFYPKSYVTDRHLLPADHPEDLKDCQLTLPPVNNRKAMID